MKRFYERYWTGVSAELGDYAYKWPIISKLIPHGFTQTILDYGCGKGKILSDILQLNPESRVYGADISRTALREAAKNVPKAKLLSINDNQRVSLPSRSCDYILSLDVIEHVYDTEKVFLEFNRLLKPGGTLLLSTPYCGLIKNIIVALIGFELVYDPVSPHIRFYTKKSLIRIVKKFGFEPNIFKTYGRFYPVYSGMVLQAKKITNISD
jgi:2-polyprenyl-3-methyl-5-hydroxy-6-metoxy-1,4-benzoquinol methylase